MAELHALVESDAAMLVNVPALLVTGLAGRGKTHLLCDVAKSRVLAGRPTILVTEAIFPRENRGGTHELSSAPVHR